MYININRTVCRRHILFLTRFQAKPKFFGTTIYWPCNFGEITHSISDAFGGKGRLFLKFFTCFYCHNNLEKQVYPSFANEWLEVAVTIITCLWPRVLLSKWDLNSFLCCSRVCPCIVTTASQNLFWKVLI